MLAARPKQDVHAAEPGRSCPLRAGGDGPVRITLTASFAAHWLMPRLHDFWAQHPEIAPSLHPDPRVIDLRRKGMDVAIRYGTGRWPGVTVQRLASARLVMVGTPSLIEKVDAGSLRDLSTLPWVLSAEWPGQRNWLQTHGLDREKLRVS